MLSPTPIEFSPLGVGHFEGSCTLSIREAFPQGDGEFRPIPGREFQELRKGAGCHGLIVSRIDVASQYLGVDAAAPLMTSPVEGVPAFPDRPSKRHAASIRLKPSQETREKGNLLLWPSSVCAEPRAAASRYHGRGARRLQRKLDLVSACRRE